MIKWLIAALVISTPAIAHSWYDEECCSDKDCKLINCNEITFDGYYHIYRRYKFGPLQIKSSQDKDCHACYNTNSNTGYCLYLPGTS